MSQPALPHLLIVDDEAGITDYLKRCFEREGFRVSVESGGWAAHERVGREPVDAVLSDLRMPAGDGIELLERVGEMPGPRPKFAIMTAYADIQPADAFHRGAFAIFEKPLDFDAMVTRFRQELRSRKEAWTGIGATPAKIYQVKLAFDDFTHARRRGEVVLGSGGLFLAVAGALPKVGSELCFGVDFARDVPRELKGKARVAWVRPTARHGFHAGVGLQFVALSAPTLGFVLAELEAHPPQPFIPIGLKPTAMP